MKKTEIWLLIVNLILAIALGIYILPIIFDILREDGVKKPMSFALEVIIFGLATCTTLVILMIITLILNYLARLATKKYNAGFRLLLCCIIVIALAEIFPVTGQKKYPFNSVSFILDLFCVTSTYFLSCLVNFNFLEVEE